MIAGATIVQERYQSPPAEAEECKTTAHYLVVHVNATEIILNVLRSFLASIVTITINASRDDTCVMEIATAHAGKTKAMSNASRGPAPQVNLPALMDSVFPVIMNVTANRLGALIAMMEVTNIEDVQAQSQLL